MIQIREMQVRDTNAVAEIERQIFSQPWSRQGFLDAVNLGNTVFLVAEENNRIIGYIGMYLAMDEGEITNVAVAPVERCHGVGGMLLTELLKIAENKGVARIVLEVRASNDSAIRMYERNGFVFNEYPYIQPPISKGKSPVPLRIMTYKSEITREEFQKMKEILYRRVYKCEARI